MKNLLRNRKLSIRMLSVMLVFVLATGMCMSAYAAPPKTEKKEGQKEESEKELTEEEKKAKAELDKAYKIPVESNAWEGWAKGPGTYGESAIVMEASTGAILYAKNIDAKQFPASITKVLTALVALENGKFSDQVKFSHDCVAFMQPGDSSVGLKEGNVITLEQALYATLLASANEAAYAVGENVGKNVGHDYNWFIEQMNAKVKELGGVNSNFVNTNGLHDPQHYTCARDMALIGSEIFKHPEFFKIVQTLEYKIPKTKTVEEHVFQQKDKMLKPTSPEYYKYTVGGKTGFTSDARSTLITMAEKDGVKLVCVVLRTYGKNVYPDTRNLLDYAFKNFTKVSLTEQEKSEDVASILSEEDGSYVMLPKGAAFTDLDMEIERDSNISREATLTYSYKGQVMGTAKGALSDAYIEANSPKIKNVKEDEKDKDGSNSRTEKTFLQRHVLDRLNWAGMSKKDKNILIGAAVLLVVLIVAFIALVIHQRRKRKLKRRRRRRKS